MGAAKIITRSEAITSGAKRYFTGAPCKRGHVAERFSIGSTCVECRRAQELTVRWKDANRIRSAAYYQKRKSTPDGVERLREIERKARAKYLLKPGVKERRREQQKSEHTKHQARRKKLRYFYGMTVEQYEKMLHDQKHSCAICGTIPLGPIKLHVDHDHATGKVRMLLCQRCNSAIGLLDDNPLRAESAANYLRKFGR